MLPTTNAVLFQDALACLVAHKTSIGPTFRGRFIQIFLGLKFFQNNIPSIYSGSFIATEMLQSLLDDLFAKSSRPANSCVLAVFEASYLARTGLIGPGNTTSQNTWRNNLNLQKGIGCYATTADLSSPTFLDEDRSLCRHLRTITAGTLAGATCSLSTGRAVYRSESNRKWLRTDPGGGRYAATDLQNTSNFAPYLAPGGARIPLVPLVVALYHDADPGLVVGNRANVSLLDFASDFNFSAHEIATYFDVSMTHPLNVRMTRSAGWVAGSGLVGVHAPAPIVAAAAGGAPQPVLGGTPAPPPMANNGWDAEQYVAEALRAAGWAVHLVSRQQLGYDIFAQRGGHKRYVEVKSSLGPCSPSLTSREWQQASYYSTSYVLAIVENFNPSAKNMIHWVIDPANRCANTPRTEISHGIARGSWILVTVPLTAI